MRYRLAILSIPVVLTLWTPTASAQEVQTTWTIAVDCTTGQSVNEALAQAAPNLTIDVRGQCNEDVVIRRDNVTLRGGDPSRDGIRSPSSVDGEDSALLIRAARNVTIANLRLSGGRREGLRVVDSTDEITVTNCRLESNGVWGASIGDSNVAFSETIFTDNGALVLESIGGGLIAARGSDVACTNCTIEVNPEAGANLGAVAFTGSTLRLNESQVAGGTAVLAQSYARALLSSSELTGATWAFQANSYGTVRLSDSTFSGPFLAMGYSTIELLGATQLLNQLQNFVTESSKLVGDRLASSELQTTLSGLTLVADYSTGRLVNGTAIEELVCGLGGDVTCDGSELKIRSTGCASCP